MEFILVVAVIAVLCIIFQVSTEMIITGILAVIGLILFAMVLLFLYFFIRLLFSKKHEAYFSRIDRPKNNKFRTAYYIVDGVEYPCVFPAEGIFLDTLYRKDRKYQVRLNTRIKCVYDRFAFATCVIGFSVSVFIVISAIVIYRMTF
ncbi:MAG: hypothetical protein K2H26_01880 [Ruminococcus sp.]|nr:hypothetical protein [Ruminococcus sp.]